MIGLGRDGGRPHAVRQVSGPYRMAQPVGDALWVFDRFQPVALATRDAAGLWTVNGLDGLPFTHVLILPTPDQADADLEAAEEAYDAEHG